MEKRVGKTTQERHCPKTLSFLLRKEHKDVQRYEHGMCMEELLVEQHSARVLFEGQEWQVRLGRDDTLELKFAGSSGTSIWIDLFDVLEAFSDGEIVYLDFCDAKRRLHFSLLEGGDFAAKKLAGLVNLCSRRSKVGTRILNLLEQENLGGVLEELEKMDITTGALACSRVNVDGETVLAYFCKKYLGQDEVILATETEEVFLLIVLFFVQGTMLVDCRGDLPLHSILRHCSPRDQRTSFVRILVEASPNTVLLHKGEGGDTPLHIACRTACEENVKLLLNEGHGRKIEMCTATNEVGESVFHSLLRSPFLAVDRREVCRIFDLCASCDPMCKGRKSVDAAGCSVDDCVVHGY